MYINRIIEFKKIYSSKNYLSIILFYKNKGVKQIYYAYDDHLIYVNMATPTYYGYKIYQLKN